jgi:hypothetical protein
MPGDQPNNPWMFVSGAALTNPAYDANQKTAAGDLVSQAHPQGIVVIGNPNDAKYKQTITGGITSQTAYRENQYDQGRPTVPGFDGNSEVVLYHFAGFALTGIGDPFAAKSAHGWSGDNDQTGHIFRTPTDLWLKVTSSVKADNPFNIAFKGGTVGAVTINSNASVTFADQVTNSSGTTRVAAAGSITQGGDAFVRSKSLILDATGGQGAAANNATSGIGTLERPFAATLNGGVVTATAGSDGIYMNLTGTSTVGKVAAKDAKGYGDINYRKTGDILAASGADAVSINFIGDNISLTALGGKTGDVNAPIVISANSSLDQNGAAVGGEVDMTAQGNINFKQTSETLGGRLDLRLKTISSASGDVTIEVANGALVDARGLTAGDALSQDQVDAIAQLLHLTGTGASQSAIDRSVKPFEALITNNYGRYFRLKSDACTAGCTTFVVPASAIAFYRPLAAAALHNANLTDAQVADYIATAHQQNGTLSLSDTALALYRPLAQVALGVEKITDVTDGQVRAYADAQYQNIVSNFARAYGSDWASLSQFTTQQTTFTYSVNDADAAPGLQAALTERAVWDPAQIVAGINQTAFQPVSPTVGNGTPNIVARNVTLTVGGGIGVLAAPVPVALSSLVDGGGGTLTNEQKAAIAAANTPGAVTTVGLDSNGQVVRGFSVSDIPAGVTVTGVEINRQAPIFVSASGTFTATATAGAAFVQSTGAPDLTVGQVVAQGDVALTSPKSILVAANQLGAIYAQQVKTFGNLTLTAGGGNIGGADHAFTYVADGNLVAAQASGSVYLNYAGGFATAKTDMAVGRVFAGQTVSLNSTTGGITGYLPGLAITAHDIALNAAAGDIGAPGNVLNVRTDGGTLTGTASGGAFINSPTVDGQAPVALTIASLSAGGPITVVSDFDLVAQSVIAANGDIIIGSGANTTVTSAAVTAQTGNAGITVTAIDDLTVGSLTAPGRVVTQAGGIMTVTAGGALTSVTDAIQVAANSLAMQANSLVAAAKTIAVTTVGNAVIGRLISAFAPPAPNITAISVAAGDATHAGQIQGNGDGQTNFTVTRPNSAVTLAAGNGMGTESLPLTVDTPWLSASATQGDIHVKSLGDIHVTRFAAPGILDLTGNGGVTFDEVKGNDIVLKSNGKLNVGNVEVTNSVQLIGTEIFGSIVQTPGSPGPLSVTITGPNGTLAQNAVVVIDPPSTIIPQLFAVDATITNIGPSFTVLNGQVPGQFTLLMGGQAYVMNNRSPAPMGWPSVQLYQKGSSFYFSQNDNFTFTNGFVVNYGPFAQTTALSLFNGMSFVRDVPRDMWNGGLFESDEGTGKNRLRRLGISPSAMLDTARLPKAVETIGDGPAVNIEGLQ